MESHFMDHNAWQTLSQPLMSLIYSMNSKSHSRALLGKSTHIWGSLGVIQVQLPWISQNTMLEWVYQCYDLSPHRGGGGWHATLIGTDVSQLFSNPSGTVLEVVGWSLLPTPVPELFPLLFHLPLQLRVMDESFFSLFVKEMACFQPITSFHLTSCLLTLMANFHFLK